MALGKPTPGEEKKRVEIKYNCRKFVEYSSLFVGIGLSLIRPGGGHFDLRPGKCIGNLYSDRASDDDSHHEAKKRMNGSEEKIELSPCPWGIDGDMLPLLISTRSNQSRLK